ncbi:hypothetical protein GUITHDRAFT_121796 [Guillardia theta CCMP2712]|uniref:Uncharacterized protein n=1 Tax=Guillardia theta (strain CCMP2712) TaxID=905079 RepID=L1I7Z9_GUITC|nr:hypothetical protein GUITHDRAFT_121796 [Guillardia theta CCMP2712]EKX32029.1 hypothetical protein GUITHDRAFT_121796 [Guillardia theta CCMP2712]|eukprot:XP_005819009.1 hypothetical protein GUITHDRAFT_121796 [Guillardia theta CCMP2712]
MEGERLPLVLVCAQTGSFDSSKCDEALTSAVRVLMSMNRLVSLQLGGSGPHAVELLCRLFHAGFKMRQISSLSLSRNKLSCKDLFPLIASLQHCSTLQCLDLSFNSIDADDLSNLIAIVDLKSLISLDLSHNACGGWFHQSQRQRLVELTACGMQRKEPARAHKEWRSCRHLAMISISSNSITDVGISSMLEAIKRSQNFSLNLLDLHDNSISDKGVHKLAEIVQMCRDLSQLYLGRNVISDFGALQMSRALGQSRLQVLELGENRIMDEGATALAEALTSCKSLAVLSLVENHVGDKGALRFAETLE